MQLNKQLILFRYILHQFGYSDFETLREEFGERGGGDDMSVGRTHFAAVISSRKGRLVDNHTLATYDEAITGYENKLRDNRGEPFLTLKYYQWFSLLFTEYYLDHYYNRQAHLVAGLNDYKHRHKEFAGMLDYTAADLKKLAYWMATGSGKTLLMHCNYWQMTRYCKDWENIILITPNEGLSRQHYESLRESGIPAKLYSGNEESLKCPNGEVLVMEITKLAKDKEGQGVTVDVSYFKDSQNLVLIDEGHKGQKSEEKTWKGLREALALREGSFTFEYSATFGQIIPTSGKDLSLLNEYGKSIVFDYSYRYFYTDGYGKDFAVFNIDGKNDYSETQHRLLLTASLLGFYEQLSLFERHREELRKYNIEKPLWVFVGSKVQGTVNQSDVTKVLEYFRYILSGPAGLQGDIDKVLSEKTGLLNADGDDIFKGRFPYLKTHGTSAEEVLRKVFHHVGTLEAWEIKQADGEIGLKTKTGEQYFGVINIGDVRNYGAKLKEDTDGELVMQDDNFAKSLFHAISEPASPINVLIGSKKFVEGWNSWRVSSMGLMNMGKSEGAQIIQLFGRGVRLKGRNLSLKREQSGAPYYIKALQTISIVGLNASYMNHFLEQIEKETPDYTEFPIDISFNREHEWKQKILTFKTAEGRQFKEEEIVALAYSPTIAKRVSIDLRNRVNVAISGFNSQVAEDSEGYSQNFLRQFHDFLDIRDITLEANRYKLLKGYKNLIITAEAIAAILEGNGYYLYSHPGQFGIMEAVSGKVQAVAMMLVKDYITKFYADKEKAFLTKYMTYEMLDQEAQQEMFPANKRIIVKVPRQYLSVIAELEANIKEIGQRDDDTLPSFHFDRHLYSPIVYYKKGEKAMDIKTVPIRLNSGETDFIKDLKYYLISNASKLEGKDVFLLRNLSKKGVGFFMESSSFYPDFILWVVEGKRQRILFLDPKGIRETRNFNDSKVIFCREQTPELAIKINDDLMRDGLDLKVSICAYILSVTQYKEVSLIWGEKGATKQEFEANRILFMKEGDSRYLELLFDEDA